MNGQLQRGSAVRVAPSILSADFANLRGALQKCRSARCRWIHLDVMDGHFVPNLTFGPPLLKSLSKAYSGLYYDVHLMIENPRDFIRPFADAGARNITFHVEAAEAEAAALLRTISRLNIHAGISIRPRTPVSAIEPFLHLCDLVLVMTVEPGFGGQKLIPRTLNKVRELVHLREQKGLSYLIQVDGGINLETTPLAVAAGSDVLVAGTAVFGNGRIEGNIQELRERAQIAR